MPKVDLKSNFININLIMKWLALNRSFQECLFICIVEVLGWDQMNYLGKIINHSCCIWHLSVILSSLSNLIDRFSDNMLLLKVFQSSALFLKSVTSFKPKVWDMALKYQTFWKWGLPAISCVPFLHVHESS